MCCIAMAFLIEREVSLSTGLSLELAKRSQECCRTWEQTSQMPGFVSPHQAVQEIFRKTLGSVMIV